MAGRQGVDILTPQAAPADHEYDVSRDVIVKADDAERGQAACGAPAAAGGQPAPVADRAAGLDADAARIRPFRGTDDDIGRLIRDPQPVPVRAGRPVLDHDDSGLRAIKGVKPAEFFEASPR